MKIIQLATLGKSWQGLGDDGDIYNLRSEWSARDGDVYYWEPLMVLGSHEEAIKKVFVVNGGDLENLPHKGVRHGHVQESDYGWVVNCFHDGVLVSEATTKDERFAHDCLAWWKAVAKLPDAKG